MYMHMYNIYSHVFLWWHNYNVLPMIYMYTPYSDDHLGSTELTAKLEPAFLSGLRCPVIHIRSKFFAIFDSSVQKRIFD